MPTTTTEPGNGFAIQASAQVQNSRIWIIRDGGNFTFGPASGAGVDLRRLASLMVVNVPSVYFNLFLYPTYDDGTTVYTARTSLEFRPVFQLPPDEKVDATGYLTDSWIPAAAPIVIPVGIPVTFKLCCAGWYRVSLEVRAGAPVLPTEGQDQLLISMSSSA